ncbi:hypothetical protein Q7P35_010517 [Cladosporium inversicolor]
MLLTQSQVSVAISSTIVVTFTIALFLSGYVLQQRTVKGLQDAIKPRIPQAPPSLNVQTPFSDSVQPSRMFGGSIGSKGRVAYQKFMRTEDASAGVNWKRLAHVQLARTHHDVCNSIMVFGELHRLKSPARKVLLFPKSWAAEKEAAKGAMSDPFMDSSRRLMRMAARRYGVELRPVDPIAESTQDGVPSTYSLISAYALADFDRILAIETPGLLLDASPLDAVLAFTEKTPFAMLEDTTANDGVHSQDLLLLQPSKEEHTSLMERLSTLPNFNDTILHTAFQDPLLLSSSTEDTALIRSIGLLHDAQAGFNATAYLDDVAYIRFSDPKLPGPEYDVPWAKKRDARPENKDADWTWTKLYGEFAQKRMDICGLDLESWRD